MCHLLFPTVAFSRSSPWDASVEARRDRPIRQVQRRFDIVFLVLPGVVGKWAVLLVSPDKVWS